MGFRHSIQYVDNWTVSEHIEIDLNPTRINFTFDYTLFFDYTDNFQKTTDSLSYFSDFL